MRTNSVGKLGKALNAAGFTIMDLTEWLCGHGISISSGTVGKYCRASSRDYARAEVWEALDRFMLENKIEWDGNPI